MNPLATAEVTAHLSGFAGRAVATARRHHFVVDSLPPLSGPNEELNPLDLLFSALATCGVFVYETVGREQAIPLTAASARVEDVNSHLQTLRVTLKLSGPSREQAAVLEQAFRTRCPVYYYAGRGGAYRAKARAPDLNKTWRTVALASFVDRNGRSLLHLRRRCAPDARTQRHHARRPSSRREA